MRRFFHTQKNIYNFVIIGALRLDDVFIDEFTTSSTSAEPELRQQRRQEQRLPRSKPDGLNAPSASSKRWLQLAQRPYASPPSLWVGIRWRYLWRIKQPQLPPTTQWAPHGRWYCDLRQYQWPHSIWISYEGQLLKHSTRLQNFHSVR